MMASAYMTLPGLKGHEITGKLENGEVYISLTDMAQDAGKSFHEDDLPKTIKVFIHKLASQEGVSYHNYCQRIDNEVWAPEQQARDFGKWSDPLYDGRLTLLCLNLRWVQEGSMLSKFKVSFAAHRHRDVQKAQSEAFNRWVSRTQGKAAISQANNAVLLTKTQQRSAEWRAHGKAVTNEGFSSAPEVFDYLDPDLAAELSLMKCLMVQEGLSLEEAHHRSQEMRLAFQNESSAA
jgi:hypothetical protein